MMDLADILIIGFSFVGTALGFLSGVIFWCFFFGGVDVG